MHFEGIAGAINVSIVAFSIVFGVLLVLTGTIFAMKLFAGSGEKKNDLSNKNSPADLNKNAPVKVSADNKKVIAAITAAIIEFTGGSNFRILSVTKAGTNLQGDYWTSKWKTAGMFNLNSNRLVRKWN